MAETCDKCEETATVAYCLCEVHAEQVANTIFSQELFDEAERQAEVRGIDRAHHLVQKLVLRHVRPGKLFTVIPRQELSDLLLAIVELKSSVGIDCPESSGDNPQTSAGQ